MPGPVANAVFDLIHTVSAAGSVADVWSAYMGAARRAGLGFGIAAFLPDDRSLAETTFANAMPGHWLENYAGRRYQDHDPLMTRNRAEFMPFAWSMGDYDRPELLPDQVLWRSDNRAAGIERGVTIPDRRDGHLKIISLCGMAADLDPDDLRALHFAGLEALMRMHELGLQPAAGGAPALSPRERECLNWIVAGKSDWEIGQILSISEKTVNTHVERAKHKLGVATRAQAIVTALRHGLIDP